MLKDFMSAKSYILSLMHPMVFLLQCFRERAQAGGKTKHANRKLQAEENRYHYIESCFCPRPICFMCLMIQELEIAAASEKLAECQETILNLGKQLKALTNSKETALLSETLMYDVTDKSNNLPDAQPSHETTKPEKRLTSQRSSLLDQMKAEDHNTGESKDQKPQAADKNGKGGNSSVYNETIEALEQILLSDKSKGSDSNCFAIVPQKKTGGVKSLWRKLLGRNKKGKSKKVPNPFAN